MEQRLLVFTDLDGTLLDYRSYSFRPALAALRAIKKRNIPLVICSSKTRAEIEVYQKKLRNRHPFIAENGGTVYIPRTYFKKSNPALKKRGKYLVQELGTPYRLLRKKLLQLVNTFRLEIKGFGDMSVKEVQRTCGLSLKQATLAKKREYDEPFYFLTPPKERTLIEIQQKLAKAGLKLAKGGRFFHLIGANDKGKAVKLLKGMYVRESRGDKWRSIGLGDGLNDLPMLLEVDIPVLIKAHSGRYEKKVLQKLKRPILPKGIGPKGWNEAILNILGEM